MFDVHWNLNGGELTPPGWKNDHTYQYDENCAQPMCVIGAGPLKGVGSNGLTEVE